MAIIKYVIADDHKIFRQGLRLALAGDHRLKCIGEASDGNTLMELVQKQQPDVILLDLKMPVMGGIEALELLKRNYPAIKVLVLTMYDDDHFIIHLMEAGANGYLLKNAEPEEIQKAIQTVYEHEHYFNDLVSNTLLKKIVDKGKAPAASLPDVKLNDKEKEVLRLICAQRTAGEIAKEMYLSQRTVEGIRSALLEKTKARNTVGLVLFAVNNGLHKG